jgi:deoxyadenosine/deoxycytidine kinase
VFAKANLGEENLKMFEFTFKRLMATLPDDLEMTYVHLVARTSTLSKRIQERGRDAESGVTIHYLDQLRQLHFEWLRGEARVYELDANAETSVVCDRARRLDILPSCV